MRPAARHPLVGVAVLAAVVAMAWWLLAPQAIGGSMAYLVVRGSSMSPGFGPGDLVVVREGSPYAPGDVVAYRTPDEDAGDGEVGEASGSGEGPVIVHRVVDVDGERLVLRGDANDVDDAIRPAPDEVLGREVLVVPGVGRLVAGIADHALVVGVVGAAVLAGSAVMARPRRRRPVDAPSAGADAPSAGPDTPSAVGDAGSDVGGSAGDGTRYRSDPITSLAVGRPGPPWLWLLLGLGVVVAAVAVVRTPTTVEERVAEPWSVRTSFGWDAPPSGDPVAAAVYGEDGLRTGETVFTSATPVLEVQVASTLSTSTRPPDAPSPPNDTMGDDVAADGVDRVDDGSLVAEAVVVSDAGWRRTVAALDPLSLEGGWATGELSVDLAEAWVTAWETGAVAGRLGEVHLEVVATTTAGDGAVAASAVQAFVLDGVSAAPLPPEPGAPPDGAPAGVDDAPSSGAGMERLVGAGPAAAAGGGDAGVEGGTAPSGSVVTDGAIEDTEVVAAEVSFGPLALPRTLAGVLVVTTGVVVLVGGMVSVVATGRARRRGEASLLVTRHRGSLVPLHAPPAPLGGDPTEVASFAALRRVADTVGQPIGVTYVRGAAAFWVTDGVRTWRYRAFPG